MTKEIRSIVSKVIKVPEDRLRDDANIFTEYGVDSLLGVEILAALDKKYNIDVPEDRIRQIKTLNDIVRIAQEYQLKETIEMSEATSAYWRKILKLDEDVDKSFLKGFHSPLEKIRPFFFFLMRFLCGVYCRLEVKGLENIPDKPPYIIAPNHVSVLDQTVVSFAIGKKKRNELVHPCFKTFLRQSVLKVLHEDSRQRDEAGQGG